MLRTASGSVGLTLVLLVTTTTATTTSQNGNKTSQDAEVEATATIELMGIPLRDVSTEKEISTESSIVKSEPQQQESTKKESHQGNSTSTSGFMPSFHLGPIMHGSYPGPLIDLAGTTRTTPFNGNPPTSDTTASGERPTSPFNNLRAIKFGNSYNNQNEHQNHNKQHQQRPFRPSDKDENLVKFVDDKGADGKRDYHQEGDGPKPAVGGDVNQRNAHHQQIAAFADDSSLYEGDHQHLHQHHHQHQQQQQGYLAYEVKPSKFHETPGYAVSYQPSIVQNENPYHQYHQPSQLDLFHGTDEKLIKPETVINVHPVSYQAATYDAHSKPKTVVYVTSHEATRTRKFPPYQYYQPQIFEQSETPPLMLTPEHEEPYQFPVFFEQPQHQRSVSPWKKILHIIGAFLPLGLLFALLSPRVINADPNASSGDPNIVLSKLRVNDLPAEHKNNRLVLEADAMCEERSICRLVAAADPASSSFLRQLLVHITERTPESAVRKKELGRIFEAAKLGNCDILTCGFYDGT